MIHILKNSTGYKRLDVYILMNIIQLETLVFCRRYLNYKTDDPCGRQFDQMTQAARSGVKNLTEGSEREATSMQNVLKLLDVAKASLCELRDDYMTWLLDRGFPPWRTASEEAQSVYRVLIDKADYGDDVNYDLARHIIATREKFRPWFGGELSTAVDPAALDSNRQLPKKADARAGVCFANAMLILIGRSLNMLGKLMSQLGEEFRREGGFSERMTAARVEAKREQRQAVDEDAPKCRLCGGPMKLRHGARGDFWGCMAYPTCRGTRPIDGNQAEGNRQLSTAIDGSRVDSYRQQSIAIESTAIDGNRQLSSRQLPTAIDGNRQQSSRQLPTAIDSSRADSYRQLSTAIDGSRVDSYRQQSTAVEPIAIDSNR